MGSICDWETGRYSPGSSGFIFTFPNFRIAVIRAQPRETDNRDRRGVEGVVPFRLFRRQLQHANQTAAIDLSDTNREHVD